MGVVVMVIMIMMNDNIIEIIQTIQEIILFSSFPPHLYLFSLFVITNFLPD